ncbi:FAD-dependent monooxygenase [Actinomycetospora sp. OC33-EN08]|uniref:FAD-dependent monooxygenase n=1 Tax=Actinomycetospora aurantiaca TaxID=3129233 RepID=A0ABU8MH15_9PSEU
MSRRRVDPVVIVGAGPVGQTTALLLARWGVPSIVLDRRARRDEVGSKAICQQRDVLDVWETVGAGSAIAAEGVTWSTARTFHGEHELFSYRFTERGRPAFPPFVNISQTRTEEILDERIAAEPSIDVRWDHRVTGLAQDDEGVTVTCGTETLRASHVVVCAGARSDDLRSLLGVGFDGQSFDDRFLIADIRAELPGWARERRFYFDPPWNPGRQVLIHPCPDSVFRIDWQVPPDYDLEAERASGALDARIRTIVGDAGHEVVWTSVYRFHSRQVDRMRVGKVLLAGDAAHLVSPFGARGLNSGVADAENAAWKLAYVLHGWAGEDLLESYHDERHAAAAENLAVTGATMDFLVPPDELRAQRRRDVLARAATDETVRPHVDSGRLAEAFWYVDSPLTTTDPTRTFGGRPERGATPPALPGVLVPDAPVHTAGGPTRLRALARDGFLLLVAGDVADGLVPDVSGPVRVLALADLDPDGELAAALDARPGEIWVIRPDAHIAAVLSPDEAHLVPTVLARAVGMPVPQEEPCPTTAAPGPSRPSATPSSAPTTAGSTTRS